MNASRIVTGTGRRLSAAHTISEVSEMVGDDNARNRLCVMHLTAVLSLRFHHNWCVWINKLVLFCGEL